VRSGKLTLSREWFDLNHAVEMVVGRLGPLLLEAADGKPPLVESCEPVLGKWDRARIEQVLTNLLSNVIRYGGGTPAKIRLQRKCDGVRLTVEDRGIGIAAEDLEKIFGRFVSGSTSGNRGGLGLGLFISRKILEAHGGSICAESQLGQGTTFTIDLPLERNGVDTFEVA
jgi:signal transduction histidine kinase